MEVCQDRLIHSFSFNEASTLYHNSTLHHNFPLLFFCVFMGKVKAFPQQPDKIKQLCVFAPAHHQPSLQLPQWNNSLLIQWDTRPYPARYRCYFFPFRLYLFQSTACSSFCLQFLMHPVQLSFFMNFLTGKKKIK